MTDTLAAANIQRALQNAAAMGLLAAGLGAGARGLKGMVSLGRRNLADPAEAYSPSRPVTLNPAKEEEEKRYKRANQDTPWYIRPFVEAMKGNVSRPEYWPPALPLAVGAGFLGGAGGYKLTDTILNARRKSQLENELERSKDRYRQALSGQHKISSDLDKLFDLYEKRAEEKTATGMADMVGGGLGLAMAAGIPVALLTGAITHDLVKKRAPEEVIRAARKRRNVEHYARRPDPIYIQPPQSEEIEGSPLDKRSADAPWPPPPIPVKSVPATTPATPDVKGGGQPNPIPLSPANEGDMGHRPIRA